MKTTLLTNIFNEEYLLPFWLHHHKNMFDDIIIIDYHSTDNSLNICKSICPNCKIITTRNNCFEAESIDKEFMDIENSIEGIKIVLNTTEFLISEIPIKELFDDGIEISYGFMVHTPYSKNTYNISNCYELFNNLLNNDIVYHYDRYYRILHNYPNGNYHIGRHYTHNQCYTVDKVYVLWFGYYPLNEQLLKRKLQIGQNVPDSDINNGRGYQHKFHEVSGMLLFAKAKHVHMMIYLNLAYAGYIRIPCCHKSTETVGTEVSRTGNLSLAF